MSISKQQLIATRADYLADNLRTGGVVIINQQGEACGWSNEVRDPHLWEPGCIAVDEKGTCWMACGGNDYDGATHWQLIIDEPEPVAVEQHALARDQWIPEPTINNMSVSELRSAVEGAPLNYMTLQAVCRRLIELAERADCKAVVS